MQELSNLNTYKKTKEYLLCVDSDGCVMDTMDIKHIRGFGPCLVKEWELFEYEEDILKRWNEINLYTMTRGINRFKGLDIILREIDEKYHRIEDLSSYQKWMKETKAFSSGCLREAFENSGSICLKKALNWSDMVNHSISQIPQEEILPFLGAREVLEYAKSFCDIAIVSSANKSALLDEWTRHELLDHVDILLAQDSGTKAVCIKALLEKGYDRENVLMIGDAPGDMSAADKNEIHFFPVSAGKESICWEELLEVLKNNEKFSGFTPEYFDKLRADFIENLS